MKPRTMQAIINRRRYDTDKATLLAGDDYWDGHNWERNGRQTFLYRTPKGAYFAAYLTSWQGERDSLRPLDLEEALELYGRLPERRVDFEDAFPGVEVEDA